MNIIDGSTNYFGVRPSDHIWLFKAYRGHHSAREHFFSKLLATAVRETQNIQFFCSTYLKPWQPVSSTQSGGALACDLTITFILSYILRKSRTGIKRWESAASFGGWCWTNDQDGLGPGENEYLCCQPWGNDKACSFIIVNYRDNGDSEFLTVCGRFFS